MSYIHSIRFSQTQLTVYSLHHIFFNHLNRSWFNQTKHQTSLEHHFNRPGGGGHFRDFMKVVENVRKVPGVGCCPRGKWQQFQELRGLVTQEDIGWGMFGDCFCPSMNTEWRRWFWSDLCVLVWLEDQVGLHCAFVPSWTLARKWDSHKARYWTPTPSLPPTVWTNDINDFITADAKVLTQEPENSDFGFVYCSKFTVRCSYLKILRDSVFVHCVYDILYCYRKAICDTDPLAKGQHGKIQSVLKNLGEMC